MNSSEPHMTKAQRKTAILEVWNEMVGELPDGAESKLPGYARIYGMLPVSRAIEKCADDESLADSEDVLEAVEKLLKVWNKVGWCPNVAQKGK